MKGENPALKDVHRPGDWCQSCPICESEKKVVDSCLIVKKKLVYEFVAVDPVLWQYLPTASGMHQRLEPSWMWMFPSCQ